jgi:glycosyltransferase involved in cell wall biosynthesis
LGPAIAPMSDPVAGSATPLVSIIVAVHNVRPYLAQCLATVAAQTWRRLEILVVDDGSTDGGDALAERIAATEPRMRLLRKANGGLSSARNAGLAAARGDYLCFVDGDDYVATTLVERLMVVAQNHGAGLACCGLYFDDGASLVAHAGFHMGREMTGPDPSGLVGWLRPEALRLYPSAWAKLYRRDVVDGLSFPEGLHFEDHPFFLAALRRAKSAAYTAEPLYFYRQGRPGQITGQADERVFDIFEIIGRIHQERAAWLSACVDQTERDALAAAFDAYVYRLLWERSKVMPAGPLLSRFAEQARQACASELRAVGDLRQPDDVFIPAHFRDLFTGAVTLSVLIPAGPDAPDHDLVRAIATAAGQSLHTLEIVVALHGRSERAVLLEQIALDEPRLRYVHVPQDASLGRARNALLDAAAGRHLTFLEVGDDLYRDSYERLLWVIEEQAADVAVGAIVYRTRSSHEERYHSALHSPVAAERWPLADHPEDRLTVAGDLWATPCNKLFAAELVRHGLAFDEAGFFEEHAFQVRLALAGAVVGYTPAPVYKVAEDPALRGIWNSGSRAADVGAALSAVSSVLGERRSEPPWRGLMVRLAYRLAWERVHFSGAAGEARARLEQAVRRFAQEQGITPAECLRDRDAYADDAALFLFQEPDACG